jgi:hypothetical protein
LGKVKWKRPETLNLSQVVSLAAFNDLIRKKKGSYRFFAFALLVFRAFFPAAAFLVRFAFLTCFFALFFMLFPPLPDIPLFFSDA